MFRSFYNANKVNYLSLPSFKSGKGPCRSLKGEVQIAIDVKLKFRFICLQIDTVMLPKMEFPWNLRFPVTVINNLYTWEKKMKYYVLISVKTISFLSLSKTSENSPKWHEKWGKKKGNCQITWVAHAWTLMQLAVIWSCQSSYSFHLWMVFKKIIIWKTGKKINFLQHWSKQLLSVWSSWLSQKQLIRCAPIYHEWCSHFQSSLVSSVTWNN